MAGKKKRALTLRQRRLVKAVAEGKSGSQATREAGYSETMVHTGLTEMLRRSKTLRDALVAQMDRQGLTDEKMLTRLQESLDATETKFFPYRVDRVTRERTPDGTERVIEDTEQRIDTRDVVAHDIRLRAVETCGRFRGYIGGKNGDLTLKDQRSVIIDLSGEVSEAVRQGADEEELVLRFGGR